MSIASLSCLKTLPIHHCFLCQIEFSICLSSFTLLRNSSLVTIKLANLFHSSYPHFKCWSSSVGVSVHVFAAYSIFATLQTKHFVIFYFNCRLDLSVNNFLFSINTFFICFKYSLCSIPHLILSYLNVGIALPLVVHQYKLSFFYFGLCTTPSSFSHLSSYQTLWWPYSSFLLFYLRCCYRADAMLYAWMYRFANVRQLAGSERPHAWSRGCVLCGCVKGW